MKKGEIRDLQLASLIAQELESAFYSANDPRLSDLTVTRLEPAGGGRHYLVFVVPEEGSEAFSCAAEVQTVLERASSYLRASVARGLNLKRTPELSFIPDPLYSFLSQRK